jgi:hypothetical protein
MFLMRRAIKTWFNKKCDPRALQSINGMVGLGNLLVVNQKIKEWKVIAPTWKNIKRIVSYFMMWLLMYKGMDRKNITVHRFCSFIFSVICLNLKFSANRVLWSAAGPAEKLIDGHYYLWRFKRAAGVKLESPPFLMQVERKPHSSADEPWLGTI